MTTPAEDLQASFREAGEEFAARLREKDKPHDTRANGEKFAEFAAQQLEDNHKES